MDPTPYLPLLGLPTAALAGVSYEPLPNDPSASYTWSSGGATTVSIWEALWNGAQEVLDVTWTYVRSAVAFYADFYLGYVESLVQFGLWVSHLVQEAWATFVQPAVEAAGRAFGQMVDWAEGFVRKLVEEIVWPIVVPFEQFLLAWGEHLADVLSLAAAEYIDLGALTDQTVKLVHEVLFGPLFLAALTIAAAVSVVLTVATAASLGASFLLGLAMSVLVTAVIDRLLDGPSKASEPVPRYASSEPLDEVVADAEAYDKERRESSVTEDPWAVLALLLGGYLGTKYAYIAALAAEEPTGNVAAAFSVALGLTGSIVGFLASKFDGATRVHLGAAGLALSFVGLMFGGMSLLKLNAGVRPVAAVGGAYSIAGISISGWTLWAQ